MNEEIFFVAVLVAAAVGWWATKRLARLVRRVARVAARRLVERAVDAALAFVTLRWLRRRSAGPARPGRPPALEGDDVYLHCPLSAWSGDTWTCRWCNSLLPRRSIRWCSSRCRHEGEDNHIWSKARDAALRRDGHACVRPRCGATSTFERSVEVNHIDPALGRHHIPGCHHHVDGLETLCGRHHDIETGRQRRAGLFRGAA